MAVLGASLVAQMVKHLPAIWETWVRSLGWKDPLENEMTTTPVLLPGKSHGWRSLVGCSPWGRKESDMTKRLHFHLGLHCYMLAFSSCSKRELLSSCGVQASRHRDFFCCGAGAPGCVGFSSCGSQALEKADFKSSFYIPSCQWSIAIKENYNLGLQWDSTIWWRHYSVQQFQEILTLHVRKLSLRLRILPQVTKVVDVRTRIQPTTPLSLVLKILSHSLTQSQRSHLWALPCISTFLSLWDLTSNHLFSLHTHTRMFS